MALLSAADFRIIPAPKQVKISEAVTFKGGDYSIENNIAGFDPAMMIRDHLATYGFYPSKGKKADLHIRFICDSKDSDLKNKNESFKIVLNKDGVTVTAANTAGAWRGASRLLVILTSPDARICDGVLTLPALQIYDYPDIADRAMKIEFANTSREDMLTQAKPYIRSVAMFGFNMIFFDFRGNLECKKYPELAQNPVLLQKDMAELIRYARACGLEVLPMTNSIGHLKRAPKIFWIYGNSTMAWNSPGKKAPVVMDLTHPDFYKVLFTYFDEVLDLFDSPRFFMIGCDEFQDGVKILVQKTGKSFPQFFSDYINACNSHLAKRSCSPLYAQDMVFPRQKPWYVNGPANGPQDALQTLDLIPKNTNFVMWKYGYDSEYPHITTLQGKGFKNVWAAPWYEPIPTAALCKRAYETGCRLFGTTWWYYPQQQGVSTVGEFAWNAANPVVRPDEYYDDIVDHYYFSRKEPAKSCKTTPAEVVGGVAVPQEAAEKFSKISPLFKQPRTYDAPELRIKELPAGKTLQELVEIGRIGMTFGNSPIIKHRPVVKLNAPRGVKELIFYDKKYGKTTRTNPFGAEITIVGDTVTEVTGRVIGRTDIKQGNSDIPENGYVISFHGKIRPTTARLSRNFNVRKGDKVKYYLMPDPSIKKTTAPAIICRFSGKKPNVRIYVSTLMPVNFEGETKANFTNFRFDTKTRGKSRTFGSNHLLSGGAATDRNLTLSAVKHKIDGINPVVCIEYRAADKSEYPVRAVFTALKEGAISGFTVLGAEEFD